MVFGSVENNIFVLRLVFISIFQTLTSDELLLAVTQLKKPEHTIDKLINGHRRRMKRSTKWLNFLQNT